MINNHTSVNWSYQLIDSQFDLKDMGFSVRRARQGPEEEFVRGFLARLSSKGEPDLRLSIFKEPRLETGSPDLVGVIWHVPTAEKWSNERLLLRQADFRILHQVVQDGKSDCSTVKKLFGLRSARSLNRLQAAAMISIDRELITAAPLSGLYSVRHIFAIEAKISAWRSALRQASINRWFATSSHVLLPRIPINDTMISEARSHGVSIWGPVTTKITLNLPSTNSKPVSYASWLFNDWAWRVWARLSFTKSDTDADTQ